MGNEMGNRNISGLQKEKNMTVEAPQKSLQEAVHGDDLKGENQIVPAAEGKDYHEKVPGLASDDPSGAGDPHVDSQTSDGNEQDETEVLQPAEGSPKVQLESNDAGGDRSGIQPASPFKDVGDHEKPVDSNLEKNLSEKNDHQIQKQTSIKRETSIEEEDMRNPTFDTKSATHNPEPLELVDPKSDQYELDKIYADDSVEDHSGSPQGSEEILGSNLTCDSEEKDRLLDTDITCGQAEIAVSDSNSGDEKIRGDFLVKEMASQEEKMLDRSFCEEKFEITDGDWVGNGMSKLTAEASKFLSESGNKCEGELPTETNVKKSLDSQSEAIPLVNLLNFYEEEVPEPKDKCMVLTEETKLIESGSEVNKHDHNPTQFCEELVKESKTDNVNASHENEEKGSLVESSYNFGINEDYQIAVATVAENGCKVEMSHNDTNLDSEEQCKDSEEGTYQMVSENGKVPMELMVTDCNPEGEEPIEKKIIEEIEEKKDAYVMGNDDAGRESTEQCLSQSLPIEQAQGVLSPSLVSPVQSQDHKQDTLMESVTVDNSNMSISDSKQESCSDIDSTTSAVETVVCAIELENEKPQQDPSHHIEKTPTAVAEIEVSANQSNEFCAKGERSGFYEAQETVGRLSIQSNPENRNFPVQIQKSPSFNFDLLIDSRTEESDQTPLLYKDKTATGSLSSRVDFSSRSPVAETEYQAMQVEENANKFERFDSEKSRTPFLSLMKEDEEAHIVVTPRKKDSLGAAKKAPEESWNSPSSTEVSSTSPKRKEKRKPMSSLFSNCMCCAAMIN